MSPSCRAPPGDRFQPPSAMKEMPPPPRQPNRLFLPFIRCRARTGVRPNPLPSGSPFKGDSVTQSESQKKRATLHFQPSFAQATTNSGVPKLGQTRRRLETARCFPCHSAFVASSTDAVCPFRSSGWRVGEWGGGGARARRFT